MKPVTNFIILEPDHTTRVELRYILEPIAINVISFTKGVDFLRGLDSTLENVVLIISSKLIYMQPQELVDTIRKTSGFEKAIILQILCEKDTQLDKVDGMIKRPFHSDLLNYIQSFNTQ